jgi:uncharacterized protein (TIGR00369 family)
MHWQDEVAFNKVCGLSITRWDPDGVELVIPYQQSLTAHEGIFHGGVVSALIDTAGGGAVMAGHDFANGSRSTTVSLSVNFLSVAPGEDLVARGRCRRRGRQMNYAEVDVVGAQSEKLLAQGLVTILVKGERPGVPD